MVTVLAKFKVKNKHYEVSVDFDEALKVKNGTGNIAKALNSNAIYYNAKEGSVASKSDLMEAFETQDMYAIATTIISRGELQKPQEFRDAEREAKVKQVVGLLMRNAVDQHGRPYTEDRLKRAIHEVHFNFDNRPAEKQMTDLLEKLKVVIPIRVETKRVKLVIPARFSSQVYGMLKDYKESEDWLANGDLQVIMNIPAGLQLEFYDKLNGITHGAVMSEELKA
jgi:ribosome maturation protein SDO1